MRFIVKRWSGSVWLYWQGERWVMNPGKALLLAKIPARATARLRDGIVEEVR